MFQSFTGNSRRPRQVNLSGQTINPFQSTSWAPTATGTEKTLANAQQERRHRQHERDRVNAARAFQRYWRGHISRSRFRDRLRTEWDLAQSLRAADLPTSAELEADRLRVLLAFFHPRDPADVERLGKLCETLVNCDDTLLLAPILQPQMGKLGTVLLASLSNTVRLSETRSFNSLRLLLRILLLFSAIKAQLVGEYYAVLSTLVTESSSVREDRDVFLWAILRPLTGGADAENHDATLRTTYQAFGMNFLTTPDLELHLTGLHEVAADLDLAILYGCISRSTLPVLENDASINAGLWLVTHVIRLHQLQQSFKQQTLYVQALAHLLSYSAPILGERAVLSDIAGHFTDVDEARTPQTTLPPAVKRELVTLVDRRNVNLLLEQFAIEGNQDSAKFGEDANILASYILILLRVFPQQSEEIRMWLYQGSVAIMGKSATMPAIKLFWRVVMGSDTFRAISHDAESVLTLLQSGSRKSTIDPRKAVGEPTSWDWRMILLFLEMYAFALRYMDDEEFLDGGFQHTGGNREWPSRSRSSALPLDDVKQLTIFLRNLAFTLYFEETVLLSHEQTEAKEPLSSYFGRTQGQQDREVSATPTPHAFDFLGIPGMDLDYFRSIVTRVLLMLYERDSRRSFLPRDHWLMTSRFDMESFIPSVVAEEERVRAQDEHGEEVDEEEAWPTTSVTTRNPAHQGRTSSENALNRQQQNVTYQRAMAMIWPRRAILQHMPFVIPFATRVQIFRQFVHQDQMRRRGGHTDPDLWRLSMSRLHVRGHESDPLRRHHARIRRNQIFEDAYQQFYALGDGLKEPIQITFVDRFDTVEAGIDGGGVTKEFLTSVTNEAFRDVDGLGMFVANEQNLLYPNPTILDTTRGRLRGEGFDDRSSTSVDATNSLLKHFEFLGRIVGKCLYEGILVDIAFAGFFLLRWASANGPTSASQASQLTNINDLRDLDESLYQGLLQLKNYTGDVDDFALDFTIADTVSRPGEATQTVTRNLLANGVDVPVTNENRPLYISAVARHRLYGQPFRQTRAFLTGLREIIDPSWLCMFNQKELQTLIGGDSSQIDVADLRQNTAYGGVYQIGDDGLEHPTVRRFWEVMQDLEDADRRKVLKYVTSTPRAPLLGFSHLNPMFSIRDAGSDEQRLPSTSTCINLLKLPRYTSTDVLREKLLYAVNSGAGFDLS